MSGDERRTGLIIQIYEQYLVDQDSGEFMRRVCDRYTIATLERLTRWESRLARRAAVMAVGLVGDYSSNSILGRGLVDLDRGVRTLSESGIRKLWTRTGSTEQRQRIRQIIELNTAKCYDEAIKEADELIRQSPWFAEAWSQRAIAQYHRGDYEASIRDSHQTLEINPYQFLAATGMGRAYLQLGNRVAALESFRRALRLNPGLDDVRAHVVFLRRALKEE